MGFLDFIRDASGYTAGKQAIQAKQQQMDMQKQEALQRQRDADFAFHEHIDRLGGLPVVNGLVQRPVQVPGGVNVTPPSSGGDVDPNTGQQPDLTSVAGLSTRLPQQLLAGTVLDKADPARTISFKDHTGAPVSYEIPSVGDQLMRQWTAQEPTKRKQMQFDADAEEQKRLADQRAAEQGRKARLEAEGVDITPEYAQQFGLPATLAGKRLLPETITALTGRVMPAQIRNQGYNDRLDKRLENANDQVAKSAILTDQATGQQFQHITYKDGSTDVKPIQSPAGTPVKGVVKPMVGAKTAGGQGTAGGAGGASDPEAIAQGVMNGTIPPDLKGLYRMSGPVQAALARKGYNLSQARNDYAAVQKHLATLNGPQQERLRQAITFTSDSLSNIQQLYDEWEKYPLPNGYKLANRAALGAAKQLPGRPGEVAHLLEAQINDLTSELGTVYKGGNSSTDESLRLAAQNLKAEWNAPTFKRAIGQIRTNLAIRRNSIMSSQPVGVSQGSPYVQQSGGGDQPQPPAVQAKPLPTALSSADVGQVYVNRAGQRIKITAVNPANAKQFRFEVQQ